MIGTQMNADFQDSIQQKLVSAFIRANQRAFKSRVRRGGSRTAPTPAWQSGYCLLANMFACV